MLEPRLNFSFPHHWQAEVLGARPSILPARNFVYPREAAEVERGALEVLIRPDVVGAQPFLATCALGFNDLAAPSGLWSAPNPREICAVAGGYAYLIDTGAPDRFTMIPYRPVLEILPAIVEGLLLFAGHHTILAWGRDGHAWNSGKLSDEGVTFTETKDGVLYGTGWEMKSDKETRFVLDLSNGMHASNASG
jgi:hypothetical protein